MDNPLPSQKHFILSTDVAGPRCSIDGPLSIEMVRVIVLGLIEVGALRRLWRRTVVRRSEAPLFRRKGPAYLASADWRDNAYSKFEHDCWRKELDRQTGSENTGGP